jgi:xylulokinase
VRAVAASLFDVPLVVPEPEEYVARGAARQAAWALAGGDAPAWTLPVSAAQPGDADDGAAVRAAYASARDEVVRASR